MRWLVKDIKKAGPRTRSFILISGLSGQFCKIAHQYTHSIEIDQVHAL